MPDVQCWGPGIRIERMESAQQIMAVSHDDFSLSCLRGCGKHGTEEKVLGRVDAIAGGGRIEGNDLRCSRDFQ